VSSKTRNREIMNQHSQLKEIWDLETELHRLKGLSNKHKEREIIQERLEVLSKEIKKK
jgi:hypothetical protein